MNTEYGKPCDSSGNCLKGKCINGICSASFTNTRINNTMNNTVTPKFKGIGKSCKLNSECLEGSCIKGLCTAPIIHIANPDALKQIRNGKYVEPQNTGANHPTKVYVVLGHGGERPDERHVVPKGCILVVKSHSGDVTYSIDVDANITAILDLKNKDAVFDPVSNKKKLFSLFTSDHQKNKQPNITASHSIAIYREGDTYPNFNYQPVNINKDISIKASGFLSLDYNTTNANAIKLTEISEIPHVFIMDSSNKYIYHPDVIKLDIPSFYSNSTMYPYYFTKQHIQDILDVILEFQNGSVNRDHTPTIYDILDKEKILIEKLGEKYLNIKKGFIYNLEYKGFGNDDYYYANPTSIIYNTLVGGKYSEIYKLCRAIIFLTEITQADIFKDMKDGIIQPGIFYNLVCRPTEYSVHGNGPTHGILNSQYIENSDRRVKVQNRVPGLNGRVSEAILQRKNQARQVYNPNNYFSDYSIIFNDKSNIKEYVNILNTSETDTYMKLYVLERKLKDIKLKAFNYIIDRIKGMKSLQEAGSSSDDKAISDSIEKDNKILANFYSKGALLNENIQLVDMLSKISPITPPPTDKEGIQKQREIYIERGFLEGKIDFNNRFIKENIKSKWFQILSPGQFINKPERPIKILTNNYRKYRNETAKKYKKVNGKWVENVSRGGRRRTRQRK